MEVNQRIILLKDLNHLLLLSQVMSKELDWVAELPGHNGGATGWGLVCCATALVPSSSFSNELSEAQDIDAMCLKLHSWQRQAVDA